MREEASRLLLAPRDDVWAILAEPFHLPDWWPGYTGVQPDRRGLQENARWEVVRGPRPGFLRKPKGRGLMIVRRVTPSRELAWHDVQQKLDMGVLLDEEADGTRATAWVSGSPWRFYAEGAQSLPSHALSRLHDLCQTASRL